MLTERMIGALTCPVCGGTLHKADSTLACGRRHSFDIARQGYVNLSAGRKLPEGDTAAMVQARDEFLASGLYAPLTAALSEVVPSEGLVVDLGGGTGHHLAAVLESPANPERGPIPREVRPQTRNEGQPPREGMVFDVSKPALKRAAKRLGAVLADTWRDLPIGDAKAQAVLNIFAPRNGPEIHRILEKDGVLIVVTPATDHLAELRKELGLLNVDESKADRLKETLQAFEQTSEEQLTWTMDLSEQLAKDLVMMGPNAFHTHDPQVRAMTVTASVVLTTWRGRPLPSHPADRDTDR